jgi:colicin import membrane protein
VLRKAPQQPRESLSSDRLALVERYMIDAEEAEARARTAEKAAEAPARLADEQLRLEPKREREASPAEAAHPQAEEQLAPEAAPARTTAEVESNGQPQQAVRRPAPTAREEARRRKAIAKAERQAAKQAARLAAAVEKREARERKALAKAAAKRRRREQKSLAKIAR